MLNSHWLKLKESLEEKRKWLKDLLDKDVLTRSKKYKETMKGSEKRLEK